MWWFGSCASEFKPKPLWKCTVVIGFSEVRMWVVGDRLVRAAAGDGARRRSVTVSLERSTIAKPFLGGYRHKSSGAEYLHASAQTYTRPYREYSYGASAVTAAPTQVPNSQPGAAVTADAGKLCGKTSQNHLNSNTVISNQALITGPYRNQIYNKIGTVLFHKTPGHVLLDFCLDQVGSRFRV